MGNAEGDTPLLTTGERSEALAIESASEDTETQLRETLELAGFGSWKWDVESDAISWSARQCEIFGFQPWESPTSFDAYFELVHEVDRQRAINEVERAMHTGEPFDSEYRFTHTDSTTRWLRARGRCVTDAAGTVLRMIGVTQDVTEAKAAEEALTRMALHDVLTGLPNRALFLDRLEHAVRRLDRNDAYLAVLFVDLDRFKVVNDGLGHAAGDEVLMVVAARLQSTLRPSDTIARFGGDEFAVLCEDLSSQDNAVELASRVLDALAEPVDVGGHSLSTGASIGIAMAGDGTAIPDALLRDADSAMYQAKEAGRGRYVIFDQATRERAARRLAQAEELRLALERGEMRVFFQPEVDLRTDQTVGMEALVRWEHPERGLVGPNEFIQLAEDTGLIAALGDWVLREACRLVASGAAGNIEQFSVNLSPRQLAQPWIVAAVDAAVRDSGLRPEQLCLEITESALMDDVEASIESLRALKALGIRLAIDDFGTGHSSLSYLRRFPIDIVKIDRSFITSVGIDPAADAIVAAVVNLSHALGLRVVAEGVETEEQLVAVRALSCDRAQGFHWARPIPAHQLKVWTERERPTAVEAEPVDLYALLVERTDALRAVTGRPIVLQAPPKLGAAIGDLRAVKTVVDHLLGNAVTYSADDLPVVISAAADRRWVRVSVADFGVGMTREESGRCFEQFWQADGGGVDRSGGTGIGLYIVRSLVEAMGGHVGAKSVPGKGSTFTFVLPRSARAAARRRSTDDTMGVSEDSTIREFMRQIGVPTRRGS